jgi:DNA-directed RNA polymerase subunit alpha
MLVAKVPTLTENKISETRSQFIIEPLEPGFGYTLGNSLRRTLLASIPGAAITSVHIGDVLYEFTTIDGIKEDVSEIVLALKEVNLSSENEDPVIATLSANTEGEVTAGDIVLPSGVTVYNPELKIATLSPGATLNIEMVIERGRGYVPAYDNKDEAAEIGRIPIDSIYSPVIKVAYKVDSTRMEQYTDFDKLMIDVETKRSTTPRDAMSSASGTLINLFQYIRALNGDVESVEVKEAPQQIVEEINDDINKNLDFLELPVRAESRLQEKGVKTIADLINMTKGEILSIEHVGATSVKKIEDSLAAMGLSLKKE